AAKKAKLKEYKVVEYPDVIDPLKSLLEESTDKIKTYYTKQELGDNYFLYQQMKKVMASSGIQARMPFEAVIK
ncbi:MAG: signal peptide peptidase SppA, partial [Pedobacter sp.]